MQDVGPRVRLVGLHVGDHLPHARDERLLLACLDLQRCDDGDHDVAPFSGTAAGHVPAQRPLNTGGRFSRNAASASWWSSLWKVTSSRAVEVSKATLSASFTSLF